MVHMDSVSDEELSTKCTDNNYETHETETTNNIILYPFAHQVGGHTQLLTLDKSTLCKPLIPRELLFYLNVPKELVNFVPSYKGVVQIRETGQGTYPPVVYQPLRSPKSNHNAKFKPGFPFELKVQIRPFADEKVLKKNLSQDNLLRADYISRPNEKYLLLLENVASKYQLPCILDLKMGTRQHGDDATEEKRHRQIAKCQASTSASLGVRLCGMQVYQVDCGGFLWYDKYYGRKMNKADLKRALYEYFLNGSQLNSDIIDDVIDRLKLLSSAIERSPSFRFYGTSLLIIHEGYATSPTTTIKETTSNTESCNTSTAVAAAATTTTTSTTTTTTATSESKRCPVDVRLIDFAHTICDYKVLCQMDDQQQRQQSHSQPQSPSQHPHHNHHHHHHHNHHQQQQQHQISSTPTTPPSLGSRKISKTSLGPDKGLLFGLENLMRLLDDLKSETLVTC